MYNRVGLESYCGFLYKVPQKAKFSFHGKFFPNIVNILVFNIRGKLFEPIVTQFYFQGGGLKELRLFFLYSSSHNSLSFITSPEPMAIVNIRSIHSVWPSTYM